MSMEKFTDGDAAIAAFDQAHARAVELLRSCKAFFLALENEDGTIYTCALPFEDPTEALLFMAKMMQHSAELGQEILAKMEDDAGSA